MRRNNCEVFPLLNRLNFLPLFARGYERQSRAPKRALQRQAYHMYFSLTLVFACALGTFFSFLTLCLFGAVCGVFLCLWLFSDARRNVLTCFATEIAQAVGLISFPLSLVVAYEQKVSLREGESKTCSARQGRGNAKGCVGPALVRLCKGGCTAPGLEGRRR